ncbi:hypothetical protein J6590_080973 [Homalodisca vitripennis]|nr:hypothetical protein J6590_080973 [Homalodisca vitripennis]
MRRSECAIEAAIGLGPIIDGRSNVQWTHPPRHKNSQRMLVWLRIMSMARLLFSPPPHIHVIQQGNCRSSTLALPHPEEMLWYNKNPSRAPEFTCHGSELPLITYTITTVLVPKSSAIPHPRSYSRRGGGNGDGDGSPESINARDEGQMSTLRCGARRRLHVRHVTEDQLPNLD